MLEAIQKNLFLKVDYHKNQSKSGISLPGVTFFLIGQLPVFITYENGKKEVAKLYASDVLKDTGKDMRELFGQKATNDAKLKNYRKNVKAICEKLEYVMVKALERKEWQGQPLRDMAVVKMK